jgi:hypothetical protein
LRPLADPGFLTTEYLSLRLQLWAWPRRTPSCAVVTRRAKRYRAGSRADPVRPPSCRAPRPTARRSGIDGDPNGIRLTALLGLDRASIRRSVARCEELTFAD